MYKLRELERKDLKKINTWRNDEEIISLLGAPYRFINQEVDEKWYEGYMQSRSNAVRCAIVEDDCDDIIGLVSLMDINFINRSVTLHIMIGNEGQGKGAGTFAVKAMCEYAFKNYGLHRIELDVLSENKRAQHVYEKCGFIQEGIRKQAVYKNGKYSDMLSYALLNNDNNTVLVGGGAKYCLMKLETSSQKEYAMRVCDNAFARSVLGRKDYFSLFQKIDLFADFCVAYTADVIGYAAIYANDIQGKTAYITLIAVCKDYQNVGVGSSLINWCERTAVQKGMKTLRLEVAKNNVIARRFYERHGFCYEEEQKKDSFYMKLDLDWRA